jgi:SAM-dependent methyltransferase
VGSGALLAFVNGAAVGGDPTTPPQWIASWDGVSRRINQPALEAIGYDHCVETDIEEPTLELRQGYDVMVLLHILEHLHEPEVVLTRLLRFLKTGGIIIGGTPTLPDLFRSVRERQLRRSAEPFGHVSVFSPTRLRQAARKLQLSVEFLTGAYFLRATGARLEQSRVWLRFNLLFGALCPRWPGEIYWAVRNEARNL